MQYVTTAAPSERDAMNRVASLAWARNKYAVSTFDHVVLLFDNENQRRDKFTARSADAGNFSVTGTAFSPDGGKIALAQTDKILFVYNVGISWGEKKSISNKFPQSSPVTCVTWPITQGPVFGLADGRVRLGHVKTNKSTNLHVHESCVIAVCSNPDGSAVAAAHADGQIFKINFDGAVIRLCKNPNFSIVAISWTAVGILAACADGFFRAWNSEGAELISFDCKTGLTSIAAAGNFACVGCSEGFFTFTWKNGAWEFGVKTEIDNFQVTALCCNPEGSRIAVGGLRGGVVIFENSIRKSRAGNFEISYNSSIAQITSRDYAMTVKSEISTFTKVNVYLDRFVVAYTAASLLLGDLFSGLHSEISWTPAGERFCFDAEGAALIHRSGELIVVLFGASEIFGSVRTEFAFSEVVCCKIFSDSCFLAFLVDSKSFKIVKFPGSSVIATFSHNLAIDWLAMSSSGTHLLFRDVSGSLHTFNFQTSRRTCLLSGGVCDYCDWISGSDVVVAQRGAELIVWYSVATPDKFTVRALSQNGKVSEIERSAGRTAVVVEDEKTGAQTEYVLDENLINFQGFVDSGDFASAVETLENLPMTAETEVMWKFLADQAMLEISTLPIAERCFAVLNDFANCRAVHRLVKESADPEKLIFVRAKLAMLRGDADDAENFLRGTDAVEFFRKIGKFDRAISLAEKYNPEEVRSLRNEQVSFLLSTGQEDVAGEIFEKSGNFLKALELYLQGGFALQGFALIQNVRSSFNFPAEVLQKISSALLVAGNFSEAGQLFAQQGKTAAALDCFLKGRNFQAAAALIPPSDFSALRDLHAKWGADLFDAKKFPDAMEKFVFCENYEKAIESSIAGNLKKIEDILTVAETKISDFSEFCLRLAQKCRENKKFRDAEIFYLRGGQILRVVTMYLEISSLQDLARISSSGPNAIQFRREIIERAKSFENLKDFAAAEKLFVAIGDFQNAIDMFMKHGNFESLLRICRAHAPDRVKDVLKQIASECEKSGNFQQAERFYIEGDNWILATQMHRNAGNWSDAKRVALKFGGQQAAEKIIAIHANSKSDATEGISIFMENGLVEQAITFACDRKLFDSALDLCRRNFQQNLPSVLLSRAKHRESIGQFSAAEDDFIAAGKPKLAIEMFMAMKDFNAASRLAEQFDKDSVPIISFACAEDFANRGDVECAISTVKAAGATLEEFLNFLRAKNLEILANQISTKLAGKREPKVSTGINADADTTMEFFYKSGRYEECLAVAEKSGNREKIAFYLWNYARVLQTSGKIRDAARLCFKYKEFLVNQKSEEDERVAISIMTELLQASGRFENEDFTDAFRNFHEAISRCNFGEKAENLSEACNLVLNREIAKRQKLSASLIAKISMSLCRYPAYPTERALREAGLDLHAAGDDSAAFYFLNRFLDVVEFIGDRDTVLDHKEFAKADLKPETWKFLGEFTGDVDEAKDLVLTWSVDHATSEKVPMMNCSKCKNLRYSNSLMCGNCNFTSKACCVTGAPILLEISCRNCGKFANKQDWVEWVGKLGSCPSCGSSQSN